MIIYIAGACRRNPGPAGAGAVLVQPPHRVHSRSYRYLGIRTNNEAEYEALLMALERARNYGVREIVVRSSSQVMINQLMGAYSVHSPNLRRLHELALTDLGRFESWQAEHVPSAANLDARLLAAKAVSEHARAEAAAGLPNR
ncbi:MAG: ribonuclease HI family protein [Chloroflexi bacterium]|nr:ribonuclease HI family protein [Chloroflexota bacterium]